jgi:broad specificity phosphatase PhoE
MPKLILIKHASPLKDATKPSHLWKLSERGREDAQVLADRLREHGVAIIITSTEPKAQETGQIIAAALAVPCETADNLHEHDRSNVPVMPTREFISMIALFFSEPQRLVLGKETAQATSKRFDEAIRQVMAERGESKAVAIVTHGTVMALFLADRASEDPFDLWRRLQLPSYVVIDWPSGEIEQIVERI